MTIVRRKRSQNYTVVSNHIWRDQARVDDEGESVALSFMAKGLLAYLLCRPDDWTIEVGHLRGVLQCGRNKAYELIAELVAFGYAKRDNRDGATGQFAATDLTIFDEPLGAEEPHPENRDTESPHPVLRDPGNRDSYKVQKETNPPNPPMGGEEFDLVWEQWPPERRRNRDNAEREYHLLSVEQQSSLHRATVIALSAYRRRKQQAPALVSFIKQRLFEEFDGAPEMDSDGDFVITPDRPEFMPWHDAFARRHNPAAVRNMKFFKVAQRWPEAHQRHVAEPSPHSERLLARMDL